jgi:hypothetical protein
MPILDSEIKTYRSAVVNDTTANGGPISLTEEASGLSASLWPNVSKSQRASGVTQYRKLFWKIEDAENLEASGVNIGLWQPTTSADRMYLFEGTASDTQADVTTPDLFGAGKLYATVLAGVTSIEVTVDDISTTVFRDGMLIRISDKTIEDGAWSVTGSEEFVHVSGTPTVSGSILTITIDTALLNGYGSTNTYVTGLIEVPSIKADVGTATVTSTAGTFDKTLVVPQNVGGMTHTLTFTFSSATAFSCTSDLYGSLGTGNRASAFEPTNNILGSAHVSVPSTCWGGTFIIGDTVELELVAAAYGLWMKRVIPAGAASIGSVTRSIMFFGESP